MMFPTNARGYSSSSRKYSNTDSRLATDEDPGLAARRRCGLAAELVAVDNSSVAREKMTDSCDELVPPSADFR